MNRIITCTTVGVYTDALTRGRAYGLLAHDEEKQQVKVRGDNDRCRWFPANHFDFANGPVPILVDWRFDHSVLDRINERDETCNWVDVVTVFSDGTRRWCSLTTPDYLKRLLEPHADRHCWGGAYKPAIWSPHLVILRDLAVETVDWTLHYLDQQNELEGHSMPLEEVQPERNEWAF